MEREAIKNHKDLRVYQTAFDAAMKIFEVSKKFPVEERYSLTKPCRGAEVQRCRGEMSTPISLAPLKLVIGFKQDETSVGLLPCSPAPLLPCLFCEAEAAETQTWIEFAVKCNYLEVNTGRELYGIYNQVLGSLVNMINNPSPWLMNKN